MNTGPALASAAGMAGQLLVAKLRVFDGRLGEASSRLLVRKDDTAVHDLRVALRRTRTILELGRTVLGRFHADEVRRALRDLQSTSGALRDEEVLLELLASLKVRRPDVQSWVDARTRREGRLRSALRRKVRDGELDRGRRLLDALVTFRVKPSRDRRLTKFARRAVEAARRNVERSRSAPLDDAEALHRARIAYKRLRYTVETFASVLPGDLAALAQPASRFQGRLGQVHDVDVALACVRGARGLVDAGRETLLEELARVRSDRVAAFQQELGGTVITPPVPKATATGA